MVSGMQVGKNSTNTSIFSATAWVTTRSGNVSRRETVLSCDRLTVCVSKFL